jgi:hypothetical protein
VHGSFQPYQALWHWRELNRYRQLRRIPTIGHHLDPVCAGLQAAGRELRIPHHAETEDDHRDGQDAILRRDRARLPLICEPEKLLTPLNPPASAPTLSKKRGREVVVAFSLLLALPIFRLLDGVTSRPGGESLLVSCLLLRVSLFLLRRFPACLAPSLTLAHAARSSTGPRASLRRIFDLTFVFIGRLLTYGTSGRSARGASEPLTDRGLVSRYRWPRL